MNNTIRFVISLYFFINIVPETPVKIMNESNAIFVNISNIIITEHPFFSLTERATSTRFTPFGANALLVVS